MSVYDPDNFRGRVALAASYISAGRRSTRTFDTCFEMQDGDAVAIALFRRVQRRPDSKLAKNIWQYLSHDTVSRAVAEHVTVPDRGLPALAKRMRDEANANFDKWVAEQGAGS